MPTHSKNGDLRLPAEILFAEELDALVKAEKHAVPASAIIGEDQGRNTLESLKGVAALLRERDLRRVVFVSDRLHMLRVLRIAQDLGLEAYGSPTASSPTDADTKPRIEALVHELGALGAYFVTGGTPLQDPPRG